MRGSVFHRLRRRLGRPSGSWMVVFAGVASALLVPALIVLAGLLAWLFITPEAGRGVGWFADPASGNWPPGGSRLGALWIFSGLALVLLSAEVLLLFLLDRAVEHAAVDTALRLRQAIFSQALRLGSADLLGRGATPTEELFNEPVERFREACAVWYRAIPRSVVLLVLLALLAVWVSFWITLVAAILALAISLLARKLLAQAELRERYWSTECENRHAAVLAKVRQLPLVAGYALQESMVEPFRHWLEHYRQGALGRQFAGAAVGPLLLLAVMLSGLLLLVIAGVNVLKAEPELNVGDVVLLVGCMLCAYAPVQRLMRLQMKSPRADLNAAGLLEYLERAPGVFDVPAAAEAPALQDELRLDQVTLADRAGAKLLDAVQLRIPAGGKVAVLSTDPRVPLAVAGLLVRFYDPAAGRLTLDGRDLRQCSLASLRRQVALVTLQGQVFGGTVEENIGCGDPRYSPSEMNDILRQIGVFESIQSLPHGLATEIGERGVRLDPRQALGVALARALLRRPSLLVLEEPPDDDSPGHGAVIDQALARAAEGRTLLVLPNRLSTLRSVDRIVVFHQGKVHVEGAHEDLTHKSDLYRHLVYLRFNPYREHMT